MKTLYLVSTVLAIQLAGYSVLRSAEIKSAVPTLLYKGQPIPVLMADAVEAQVDGKTYTIGEKMSVDARFGHFAIVVDEGGKAIELRLIEGNNIQWAAYVMRDIAATWKFKTRIDQTGKATRYAIVLPIVNNDSVAWEPEIRSAPNFYMTSNYTGTFPFHKQCRQ
jgi:hypothetical protein